MTSERSYSLLENNSDLFGTLSSAWIKWKLEFHFFSFKIFQHFNLTSVAEISKKKLLGAALYWHLTIHCCHISWYILFLTLDMQCYFIIVLYICFMYLPGIFLTPLFSKHHLPWNEKAYFGRKLLADACSISC